MDLFWKAIGAALICAILALLLAKQAPDMGLLMTLAGCCLIALAAMNYLGQITDFLARLEQSTGLDQALVGLLMKIVGLGIVGEFAVMVCTDAGNTALGKVLQLLTSLAILWVSLPLFEALLELIDRTLVGL